MSSGISHGMKEVVGGIGNEIKDFFHVTAKMFQTTSGLIKAVKFSAAALAALNPSSLILTGFKETDKAAEAFGFFGAVDEVIKSKKERCLETANKVVLVVLAVFTAMAFLDKAKLTKFSRVPVLGYALVFPVAILKLLSLTLTLPGQIAKAQKSIKATKIDANPEASKDLDKTQAINKVNKAKITRMICNQAVLTVAESVAKIAFITLILVGTYVAIPALAATSFPMLMGALALATFSLGNAFYKEHCNLSSSRLEPKLQLKTV